MVTLGTDMDGVIADWHSVYIDTLNELTPTTATAPLYLPEKHVEYDIFSALNYDAGIPDWMVRRIATDALNQMDYNRIKPIEGAVEALNAIKRSGIFSKIYIVSKPTWTNVTCATAKHNFLVKYFGEFFADNLILTDRKDAIDVTFLIDDHPFQKLHQDTQQILFDQPYNRLSNQMPRMMDWSDSYTWMLLSKAEREFRR